jgi:caffeoyl-CoA O-methyltransferase
VSDQLAWSEVQAYLGTLVPPRSDELDAMEARAHATAFPIIGPVAGFFCYQIARMVKARRVFELGSGFGYSTAWFARAVAENGGGQVHHVVWDESLSREARERLGRLGYGDVVRYHVGEAVAALRAAQGPFDLVFNDIDKDAYPDSLAAIEDKLRPGGILIVDNALWHGRVLASGHASASTNGVVELTRLLATRPGWVTTLVPIRDGLLLALRV